MKKSDKQDSCCGSKNCCQSDEVVKKAINTAKKLKATYDRQPAAKKEQINKKIIGGAAALAGLLILKKIFKNKK